MAAISAENFERLKTVLDRDFVPHLPPLLAPKNNADDDHKKNLSRAFSGFAIRTLSGLPAEKAAAEVVDDYDDGGIDAIHFAQLTQTLYIIQGKLKKSEQFKQEEAQSFILGVQKLLVEDFSHFNANVQNRSVEIEGALEECHSIQLVAAYSGDGMSGVARKAIEDYLASESKKIHKLNTKLFEFDSVEAVNALSEAYSAPFVQATLNLTGWHEIDVPKRTYYGIVGLSTLVELYDKYGETLFNRNIRFFLGQETDVNSSILDTLISDCANFFYLNNGVTALCKEVVEKNQPQNRKRIQLNGLSIINGAQTVATAAKYISDNPGMDISEAKVMFTVIQVPDGDEFGVDVTKARNHQNAVSIGDFAALDPEQERLRRDIASLGARYIYRSVGANRTPGPNQFYVDEASQALAIVSKNAINTAYLRDRPTDFLDVSKNRYRELFKPSTTAYQLINAVKVSRYLLERISLQADAANGNERLTYRNGNYLLAWLMTRRCTASIPKTEIINEAILPTELGRPLDDLRQIFFEETSSNIGDSNYAAFFKNQTQVKSLAKLIMIRHFGIVVDEPMRRREEANPDNFIEHLASFAPQINLHE